MSAAFLDRESSIAPPGYNRFLFPPAALAVHLCIGQAYAFSTFNLPLTKLLPRSRLRRRRREENSMKVRFIVLWAAVLIPLAWGAMKTLQNALKLFN